MEKIYRFRSFGESWSLDDLKNSTITGITNDKMNDPYDCHFYYDKNKVYDYVSKNGLLYKLKKCSYSKKLDDKDMEYIVQYISDHLQRCIEKSFFTTCFTKNLKKEIMWAHYSNNGKGFVLEYDEKDIEGRIEQIKTSDVFDATDFKKVNYIHSKQDYTDFIICYIKNLVKYPNNFLDIEDIPVFYFDRSLTPVQIAKKIVFDKNEDWGYEGEYRLVILNDIKNNGNLVSTHKSSISNISPTAIYLGENCPLDDKQVVELIKEATSRDIKIYKMKSNYTNKEFSLDFDELKL